MTVFHNDEGSCACHSNFRRDGGKSEMVGNHSSRTS